MQGGMVSNSAEVEAYVFLDGRCIRRHLSLCKKLWISFLFNALAKEREFPHVEKLFRIFLPVVVPAQTLLKVNVLTAIKLSLTKISSCHLIPP